MIHAVIHRPGPPRWQPSPSWGHLDRVTTRLERPLDDSFPLPLDQPFTRVEARAAGITDRGLRRLVERGHLRRPLRGVFVDTRVPDDLDHRVAVLAKVMPPGTFVCDRTAGWLHGANMILAPGDHLEVPRVSLFGLPGCRTRQDLTASGERQMRPADLCEVRGIVATTPLRTALDLGRRLHRAQALAALDSMLGLGAFELEELTGSVERFAKFRGVRQLRSLAPLADGLAGSPGESALRLHWYDASLPRPTLQIPHVEGGRILYYLDLGLEAEKFAAEYDGEEWHSSPEDVDHDRARRRHLREHYGWQIEEYRKEQVFGHHQCADWRLRDAIVVARRTFDRRTRFL